MPLYVEPFGQFLLDQALARHEPAENDLLLERRGNAANALGGLSFQGGHGHASL